jgi:hypothetical protein
MRSLSVPLVLIALAVPVAAAEKEAPAKDTSGAPGTNVDMPFLMAPMTGPDGKLSGYAYISTRLTATSDIIANQARDKIAFIQDAFVRDVNATEIATSGDPRTVNNSVLEARLLADARKVVGAGKIVSIAIMQVQIAPLHPGPVTAVAGQPTADSAPAAPVKPAPTH